MFVESMSLKVWDPFYNLPAHRMTARKCCLKFRVLQMRLYMFFKDIFPQAGAKPPFMRGLTIAYSKQVD
jgi:hypothetical protein